MSLQDEYLADDFVLAEAQTLNHGFASVKAPFYAVCSSKKSKGKLSIAYRRYSDGCTGFVNARYVSAKDIEKYLKNNDMPPISLLKKSKSTAEPNIKASCDIPKPKNVTEFIKENKVTGTTEKGIKREIYPGKLTKPGDKDFLVYGDTFKLALQDEKMDARYALIEIDNIQPSHLFYNFARNPKYPARCQENDYEKDASFQADVKKVARELEPRYLLLDTPTPIEGAPIITKDGIVMGGNGRSMSLNIARVSYPENFQAYQNMLYGKYPMFGFKASDLKQFKDPILVRVINIDMDKCSSYSVKFNKGTQKETNKTNRSVAIASDLKGKDLQELSEVLQNSEAESFAKIKDDREAVKTLIIILRRAGVINDLSVNSWLEPDGQHFSKYGLMDLETMLLSIVLGGREHLEAAQSYSNLILKALAYFLRLQALKGKWNLVKYFKEAIKAEHERREKGFTKSDVINQVSAFGEGLSKNAIAAWNILDVEGDSKHNSIFYFKKIMEKITIAAENEADSEAGAAMFGGEKTEPYEVMNKFLNKAKDGTLQDNLKEYVVWGIPPNEKHEIPLFAKAENMQEAKNAMHSLEHKYKCSKLRIQVIDFAKPYNPAADIKKSMSKTLQDSIEKDNYTIVYRGESDKKRKYGNFTFVTPDKDYASTYGKLTEYKMPNNLRFLYAYSSKADQLVNAYLHSDNVNTARHNNVWYEPKQKFIDFMVEYGYDGFVNDDNEEGNVICIFNKNVLQPTNQINKLQDDTNKRKSVFHRSRF